jgi:hypothetical protein
MFLVVLILVARGPGAGDALKAQGPLQEDWARTSGRAAWHVAAMIPGVPFVAIGAATVLRPDRARRGGRGVITSGGIVFR